MKFECRPAQFDDFPSVFKLQQLFFDSRHKPIQEREKGTIWYVCLYDTKIVGIYSYHDFENNQRWFQDFYIEPSKIGIASIRVMVDHLEESAELDSKTIHFAVEAYNVPWIKRIIKRGYICNTLVFSKPPVLE